MARKPSLAMFGSKALVVGQEPPPALRDHLLLSQRAANAWLHEYAREGTSSTLHAHAW